MADVHPTLVAKTKATASGCVEWIGARNADGYGLTRTEGKQRLAHRVSYERSNGVIPDGLCVLHRCDNPPCLNPDHLFVGTRGDNAKDCTAKGRNR